MNDDAQRSTGGVRMPTGFRWVRTLSQEQARTVHLAVDERNGQQVVVEVYPGDPGLRARLAREAAQATGLRHPYVVPVLDVGDLDGSVYTVSPFVDGPDLGTRLATGPLPGPSVVTVLGPVADALDLAHRAGLTHRGLGPGSVVLAAPSDVPCLRGFGTAPESGFAGIADPAPEQVRGGPVGPRTDVYALGVLLFRCLTGRAPFVRNDPAALRAAHANDTTPRVSEVRPDLPRELDDVVGRAMEKDPARRTESCRAVIDAAAAVLDGASRVPAGSAATQVVETGPQAVGQQVAEGAATQVVAAPSNGGAEQAGSGGSGSGEDATTRVVRTGNGAAPVEPTQVGPMMFGAGQQGAGQQGGSRPEAAQPGNGQSGSGQAAGGQPGSGQSDAGRSSAGQFGSPWAGPTQFGQGQPGGGQPGGGQFGGGQPGGGQPGAGQFGGGQPGVGQFGGGQSGGGQFGGPYPGAGQYGQFDQTLVGAVPGGPPPPGGPPRRSKRLRVVLIALAAVLVIGVAAVIAVPRIIAAGNPTSDELARVPATLRTDCRVGDKEVGPAGAARVLICGAPAQEANIGLFDTPEAADAAYRGLLAAAPSAKAGAGDCADGPGVESGYPGVGEQTGRVFCVRDGSAVRMTWIDRAARTVSAAIRPDGNALDLYRAWSGWVGVPTFPTAEEQKLLGTLRETGCRRAKAGTLDTLDGLVAAVDCPPPASGASTLTYYMFGDAESLRRAYQSDVESAGSPPDSYCGDAKKGAAPGNSTYGSPVRAGRVLCGTVDGKALTSWTTDALFVLGRATGADLTAVKGFWRGNGGPTLVATLAAINAAASPAFPNTQEAALLTHVPTAIRPYCARSEAETIKNLGRGRATAVISCATSGGAYAVAYAQYPDAAGLATAVNRPVTGPDCQSLPPAFNGVAKYARPGSTGTLDCGTPTNGLSPFIDWTKDGANIFAYAYGPTPAGLIAWWKSGVAGPI